MACRLLGDKLLPEIIRKLLIGPLETNFSEIQIKIQNFAFKKMQFENDICQMLVILSRRRRVKMNATETMLVSHVQHL